MLDVATIKQQLDAAHGALKAAQALIVTLYGALEVAESRELTAADAPAAEAVEEVAVEAGCAHPRSIPAAVMGDRNRRVCPDCGESFSA